MDKVTERSPPPNISLKIIGGTESPTRTETIHTRHLRDTSSEGGQGGKLQNTPPRPAKLYTPREGNELNPHLLISGLPLPVYRRQAKEDRNTKPSAKNLYYKLSYYCVIIKYI
jgi:hypothetical protein